MTPSIAPGPRPFAWTQAARAARLNPSTIREILKLTEREGVISLAGGLPAPESFPVAAVAEAMARVLRDHPREALQYAASEGYAPLREWVAQRLAADGIAVSPAQVLITTGSQQGLDLIGKVLVDPGSRIAVEQPTYLGALQAFSPFEPRFQALEGDDDGPLPESVTAARDARLAYLLPTFQNPSGRCMSASRRTRLVEQALSVGLPLVEDNPYGELWYDEPPPPPLAATAGDAAITLGSFSKTLAPGLRLGYLVAPAGLYPKLLQAKQAADLHTPGLNQRVAYEIVRHGFLDTHLPPVRERYRRQRDAMAQALSTHLPAGCRWRVPSGGMFFWVEGPAGLDAAALLPRAVAAGVAFVPGEAFYAAHARSNTLRLSFVTVSPAHIDEGVRRLATVMGEAMAATPQPC